MGSRSGAALAPAALALGACVSVPEGIEPVAGFDAERYLGTWYEIARLDHRFERGLENVTAEYSRGEDGTLRVVNRGWDADDGEWSEVEGRARFVEDPDTGHLKVSFFGPFWSSYVVFELDEGYERAYVTGNDRDTLWLLARTPTVEEGAYEAFVEESEALGFDVDGLIRVEQDARARDS